MTTPWAMPCFPQLQNVPQNIWVIPHQSVVKEQKPKIDAVNTMAIVDMQYVNLSQNENSWQVYLMSNSLFQKCREDIELKKLVVNKKYVFWVDLLL